MNNIFTLLNSIGIPVLNFLKLETLYSSLLFVIIFILSVFIGKKYPLLQMGLWMLLLLRLVLPTTLSSCISLGHTLDFMALLKPLSNETPGTHPEAFIPLINSPAGVPIVTQIKTLSLQTIFILTLLTIWFCGTIIFASIFYIRIRQYKKILACSKPVTDVQYKILLNKWKNIFKVRRTVRLVTSHHELSPFTTGLFKPVIYLPTSLLTSLDIALVEPVIAHEMAHIKSLDSLWIRLQNIIHSIYFFHPAVWIANLKINQAREYICDGQVLMTQKMTREEYGKGLLNILKLNLPGMDCPAFIPGFKSPTKNMKHRINIIKGEKLMNKSHIILSCLIILMAGMFLLPMAGKGEKNDTAQSQVSSQDDFAMLAENVKSDMNPTANITFKKPIDQVVITAQFGAEFMFNGNKIKHKGIDLKAATGTNVYAAADGIISTIEEEYTDGKGYGKYIVIQHDDGFKTIYAHLDKILTQKNNQVNAGDLIGKVGNTGQGTGPHLHFELLHQDEPIDPASYINF